MPLEPALMMKSINFVFFGGIMFRVMNGLFALVIFLCTGGHAAPNNYEGRFQFQSQIKTVVSKSNLWVRVGTSSGENVLNELRKEGFACKAQPQSLFACSKFTKIDLLPETRQRLLAEFNGFFVEFRKEVNSFTLVNDSDLLKEWEREQKVLVNSRPFYKVRHMESSGAAKIHIASMDSGDSEWFNIEIQPDGYGIRYPVYISQNKDSKRKEIVKSFDSFLVELILEKTN